MAEYKSELYHYGVLGMKWGVRRYQNPDGTLTKAGKKRINAKRNAGTMNAVNAIVDSMPEQDKRRLGLLANEKYQGSIEEGEWIAKRILLRDGDKPIAFFDVYADDKTANVALGVRGDYQGKGYGKRVTELGMRWINKNLDKWQHVEWSFRDDNVPSQRLAERHGFAHYPSLDYTNENGHYQTYIKSNKHS
jgi:GNAT superfamily N-acetyltransferase